MHVANRYKDDLGHALIELNRLIALHEDLEAEIARQKKRVGALQDLVEADGAGSPPTRLVGGITDACRTVLRAAGRPLLPIEVRDGVERLGLPPQANLLASVYTVLRRLELAGEVVEDFEAHRNPGGSALKAYRWAGPMQTLGYPNPTNTQKR